MPIIKSTSFQGGAGVNDGALADAVRGIAQTFAARAAAAVDDLTADNSGGTPGAAIAAIPDFTLSVLGTNDAVAKAELETAFDGVVDAVSELIAQANAVRAVIPDAFALLVDNTGGTAADGTIAAIDVSATGAGASLASATGTNTVLSTLRSRVAQIASYVNKLCVATGVAPLTLDLTSHVVADAEWGVVFAAVDIDTGATVSGADTTAANACVLKTEFDTTMPVLANAVASMAAKLDAITADANATKTCGVVAG